MLRRVGHATRGVEGMPVRRSHTSACRAVCLVTHLGEIAPRSHPDRAEIAPRSEHIIFIYSGILV